MKKDISKKDALKSFGAFKDNVWNGPKEETEGDYEDTNYAPQSSNKIEDELEESPEDAQRGRPPPRGQPRGRGRGRARRGGQPGRSVYHMTKEEIENKEKLKKGRENQTRRKGGHHNHKEKAAKKYGM